MKDLLALLGIVALLNGANAVSENICVEADTASLICCEGWTGSIDNGCAIPVCEETCQYYGGTCVAPNVCMGCPDGRFGDNCEKSRCEMQREEHETLGWIERHQRLKPRCLPDGSYALQQCHVTLANDITCHCVDRWTGQPHVDTFTKGAPDCSEYYVDEKPLFRPKEVILTDSSSDESVEAEPEPVGPTTEPCRRAHEAWEASRLSFFANEPNCADDGYYVNYRCEYFLGYCVCVDRQTGHDIEYTRVHSMDIDCSSIAVPEPEPESEPEPLGTQSPSEEGCFRDGRYYPQDKSFYDDCNLCVCHGYNLVQCTTRDCTTDACHLGEVDKVVEHIHMGQCHRCVCNHGVYDCEMTDCDELNNPGEMTNVAFCGNKPPMTHYYDECNNCYCSGISGVSICTLMQCYQEEGGCYVDLGSSSRFYQNGQQFTRGCDTYQCVDGSLVAIQTCADTMVDMVLTQEKPQTACTYDDEDFFNGESMLLGYKMCKCENFSWNCQLMMEM